MFALWPSAAVARFAAAVSAADRYLGTAFFAQGGVLRNGGQLPALPDAIPPPWRTSGDGDSRHEREVRELGAIPPHIKKVVGWEAIAWHTAEWWRFQWAITELVEVTSAWLPQDAWRDWLLWARAAAERTPDGRSANQPIIDMLTTDGGEFPSFALITARKNGADFTPSAILSLRS